LVKRYNRAGGRLQVGGKNLACATISYSGSVGTWTNAEVNVILPDRAERAYPLPVLYLLHDMSGNHTTWTRFTRLEWYARDLPLVIVMPDGENGFYTDFTPGHAYEQLVIQDLVGFIERFFPVCTDRTGRAITGFGAGGYGALKLALKYPDLFGSVTAHGSAWNFGDSLARDAESSWKARYRRVVGRELEGTDDDIFALAQRCSGASWPDLRFDCGLDDPLIEENRAFHVHLERLGVGHQYRELPGSHDWDYCDDRIAEALQFHWQRLAQRVA
jgi:putative tributyrin esterase